MVIGTIETVDSTGIAGTVRPDESGETYEFTDRNFPTTGLGVGDECMFDITCFKYVGCSASNLQPITIKKRVIKNDVVEDLTIGQMDLVVIKDSAKLTGNVSISGGELKIKSGTVDGLIDINNGGFALLKDGVVTGAITVNKSRMKIVNGTAQSSFTSKGDGELVSRSGGVVTGAITVNKGDAMRLLENSSAGSLTVLDDDVDLVVKTGGMVHGAITVNRPTKIKIGD
jgi:hypothetical protein